MYLEVEVKEISSIKSSNQRRAADYILLSILCNLSQPTEGKEIFGNEIALELSAPLE